MFKNNKGRIGLVIWCFFNVIFFSWLSSWGFCDYLYKNWSDHYTVLVISVYFIIFVVMFICSFMTLSFSLTVMKNFLLFFSYLLVLLLSSTTFMEAFESFYYKVDLFYSIFILLWVINITVTCVKLYVVYFREEINLFIFFLYVLIKMFAICISFFLVTVLT